MGSLEDFLGPYMTRDSQHTHLFLDGGKADIPHDKEQEFIRAYSRELDLGNKVYIVEKRPDVFRYMIDVDIIDTEYWGEEKIKDLIKLVQSVLFEFYETDMNVICCLAPEKRCKNGVKTGIHLIWPRHFINCEDALTIREAILIKLGDDWGLILNSWTDAIDELVYLRNGYRMVGSDKLVPKTNTPENRPYKLFCILDSNGRDRVNYFNRLNTDNYSLILDTSIRFIPLENSKLTIPFKSIPKWLPLTNIKKSNKSNTKTRVLGTVEYEIIQNFMESELPDSYNHQSIKDIRQYPDGNFLIITDSSYCMNIQRDHNSCGIYFFCNRKGIYQKCLCPCDNLKGRLNGYCKNYISQCYEFSKDISDILFPKPEKPKFRKKIKSKNLSSVDQTKSKYLKVHASFCDDLLNSLSV